MDQGEFQGESVGARLHPQEVKPFFNFIEKAFRAVSLYSENHPLLKQFIKSFTDYINLATEKLQSDLIIQLNQYQGLYAQEVIYDGPRDNSNLALLFYNGSVSAIGFSAGISEEEVRSFLMTLWKSKHAILDEESLNILLWDLNLEKIQYQAYDELTMYDLEVPDISQVPEQNHYQMSMDNDLDASRFMDSLNFFNLLSEEEIEAEFTLTEAESALLEEDIGLTESPAIQFVWAALRLFEIERDPKIFTNILRTIKNRLRYEIEQGEFSNGALMAQQIESAKLAFNLEPEYIGELTLLLQNFVDADLLELSFKTLTEKESVNWHAVKSCFAYTNLSYLPQLVKFLSNPETKEAFTEIVKKRTAEHVELLFPYLKKDQDANTLIAICRILEASEERSMFKNLVDVTNHPNAQVKDVVLSLLYKKFPKETSDLFITKLSDPDKNIRKIARENLPRTENKQVFLKILSILEDADFSNKDLAEKRELFNAFAVCGQELAIFNLEEIINKSVTMSIFRKDATSKLFENKKCAVRALAYIKNEKALNLLQTIEKSKNAELNVLAKIALSEREKLLK